MRARGLKPAFFKNELLATSDPLYAWIFQGLWCLADRAGRLEDRPRRIHLEVNPGRAFEGTDEALKWLDENEFIERYEAAGVQCIQVVNFEKHQYPHVREPDSKLPERPEPDASTGKAPDEHQAGTSSARLTADCGLLTADCGEKDSSEPPAPSPPIPLKDGTEYQPPAELIAEWKAAYPNIVVLEQLAKLAAWNRSNPKKRKTRAGVTKHINGWLANADKEARAPPETPEPYGPNSPWNRRNAV